MHEHASHGAPGRRALIVGAGIGGLAAGVALQRIGWSVRVLERATSPRELGFALLLAPNAIAALRKLGLADRIIEGGARFTGGEMRRVDGRLLRSFDLDQVGSLVPELPLVALRPVLHGALLEALGPQALTLGAEASGVSQRDGCPVLSLADGRSFEGDIVIGADGVGSAIRRALHPDAAAVQPSGLFALRGVVHGVRTPERNRGVQYFGRGLEAAVAEAGGDAVYWYISLTADHLPGGSTRGGSRPMGSDEPSALARELTATADPLLRSVVEATRPEDIRLDELFVGELEPRWGIGRVTLLGDAAHPMLPHAGQGAAQALEDAVALGHVLESVEDAGDVEPALRRYERLRSDRARRVMLTARRNARVAAMQGAFACWLRDRLLSVVPSAVIAKSYVAFGTPPELRQASRMPG